MGFIETFIEGKEYKWIWYLATLFSSMIPVIVRFFVGLGVNIPMFDIKDLLFAGLAMNLANLTLIGQRQVEVKWIIMGISSMLIIFISVIIAVFLSSEADHSSPNKGSDETNVYVIILYFFAAIFVVSSILLSYAANNYVYRKSLTV